MRSHPGSRVLVVSVTEDQAELMLARILDWLPPGVVAKGKNKPTKHKVVLNNKSWVMTKAAGSTGAGMRGLTVDVVIVDEAAHVPEIVFSVLSPMLLTTGGRMWLLSTPNAMEGYFFKCYTDPAMGFVTFHVNSSLAFGCSYCSFGLVCLGSYIVSRQLSIARLIQSSTSFIL